MKINSPISIVLASLLSACGGGGGGGSTTTSPAPTVPTVPSPPPVVRAIAPAIAIIGNNTTFTVSGTDLVAGMKFAVENCDGAIEVSGGNATSRQYSCTPSGTVGLHTANLFQTASATTSLFVRAVDYQASDTSVDNGSSGAAAVTRDGSLFEWGSGLPATKVGDGYSTVVVGWLSTLAIKKDGSLWTWGSNGYGTLGTGDLSVVKTPTQVGTGYKKVAIKGANTNGGESVVALKSDGSIWVWGSRSQLEPNVSEISLSPRMIATGFTDIASGANGGMYGIKADGSLWTWDRNLSDTPFTPVRVGEGYVLITTSYDATFGLKKDGTLWNWDRNAPNKPATGETTVDKPVLVGSGFRTVTSGAEYAMAIKDDGTLWAGGNNAQGQFGDDSMLGGTFRQVGSGFKDVWAGDSCTVVQKTDGTLWAAGLCPYGDGDSGYSYKLRKLPTF